MIAVFTPKELQTLYAMAVCFITTRTGVNSQNRFKNSVFYRDKPADYFLNISTNNNNIMTVYIKDDNGDPASIINGQIDGLFFATRNPQNSSHFGDTRVTIPAEEMLTTDKHIYFADFYCKIQTSYYTHTGNHKPHYVTVVMTKPGSDTDRFCESNLIKLDITDNPILKRNHDEVTVTSGVWVEVLYTEDVDLSRPECTFTKVQSTGSSRPGGIPKDPLCRKCNVPNSPTELFIDMMKEMELK